jgi:hypothetical protein
LPWAGKRQIIKDTNGFLVGAVAHSAGFQDRYGVPLVSNAIRRAFPQLRHEFAGGGSTRKRLKDAPRHQRLETRNRQAAHLGLVPAGAPHQLWELLGCGSSTMRRGQKM